MSCSHPPPQPAASPPPAGSLDNPDFQATLRRSIQADSASGTVGVAEGVLRALGAVVSGPGRSFKSRARPRSPTISLCGIHSSRTMDQSLGQVDGIEMVRLQRQLAKSSSREPATRSSKANQPGSPDDSLIPQKAPSSPPHSPAESERPSTSSSSSSSSSSNWWQFWRTDSTSSGSSSPDSNSSFFRKHSEFTLMTPAFSSNPTTSERSSRPRFFSTSIQDDQAPYYDSFTSGTVNPALQRLLAFWKDIYQDDSLGSDLGLQFGPPPPIPLRASPTSLEELDIGLMNQRVAEGSDTPLDTGVGVTGGAEIGLTKKLLLPKIKRQPLSEAHKLSFNEGGRLHNLPTSMTFATGPTSSTMKESKKGKEVNMLPKSGAWWLDVTCPNEMDMVQLSKIFDLHPLTIEDILIQETREKMQTFDRLGYYLVCFRALDEGHFKYVEDQMETEGEDDDDDGDGESQANHASLKTARTMRDGRQGGVRTRKGRIRVEIAEGVGVEGVGLGAVNVYLVVFGDGIISFHFEDLQKHIDRVKDRIQTFSAASHYISPHWIAHELMDSIIDAFFPMLSFVEQESDELDEYLANPLQSSSPPLLIRSSRRSKSLALSATDPLFDRSKMLTRITTLRKLVVVMSRLLVQKVQTVQGLRKRMRVVDEVQGCDFNAAGAGNNKEFNDSGEIHLYLGDLQDHIVAMLQTLNFYDTLLSNAHLIYLGILRLAYDRAKQSQDIMIVRLYIMSLIALPMLVVIGFHSMNINIPKNGDKDDHVEADGSSSPYYVFGIVIVLCGVVGSGMALLIWWIFRKSEKAYGRKVLHWRGL